LFEMKLVALVLVLLAIGVQAKVPGKHPKPVKSAPASCMNGQGICQDSSQMDCANGQYVSGQCPGSRSIQCCVADDGDDNNVVNNGWHGKGVDLSDPCSATGFACLKKAGYQFAVIRAWRSSGSWDPDCPANINNAINSGMSPVDVYMFPRPKGATGTTQATQLWNNLKSTRFNGTIWFDVEQESPYWSTQAANQKFFNDVINTLTNLGASVGIYTSKSQWTEVMGSTFKGGASLPLWYSHYDNTASFADFSRAAIGNYGGWTKPAIKQYQGDQSACGCNTDFNYAS